LLKKIHIDGKFNKDYDGTQCEKNKQKIRGQANEAHRASF
jgi:hypothetical protein